MSRRVRSACSFAIACLALTGVVPAIAGAHEGDPRYRSVVRSITPPVEGLSVRVVDFDDNLSLVNQTGETIVVLGYQREPYARIAADGTVSVNRNSPAAYLNDDRFAQVAVPETVREQPRARPRWEVLDRTGRFSWHDHRMHWMAQGLPAQVTDPARRTRVFDYEVPLRVAGRAATIKGTLWWVGEDDGGMPVAALVALAARGHSATRATNDAINATAAPHANSHDGNGRSVRPSIPWAAAVPGSRNTTTAPAPTPTPTAARPNRCRELLTPRSKARTRDTRRRTRQQAFPSSRGNRASHSRRPISAGTWLRSSRLVRKTS